MRVAAVLLGLLPALGCASAPDGGRGGEVMRVGRATPWRVVYHDGSGNGFEVSRAAADAAPRFAYDPVTPAESSSGVYSGGSPRSGTLPDERAEELWRVVERLEGDPSLHAAQRRKGTGALRLETPAGERVLLLEPAALGSLEELLGPLRGE